MKTFLFHGIYGLVLVVLRLIDANPFPDNAVAQFFCARLVEFQLGKHVGHHCFYVGLNLVDQFFWLNVSMTFIAAVELFRLKAPKVLILPC